MKLLALLLIACSLLVLLAFVPFAALLGRLSRSPRARRVAQALAYLLLPHPHTRRHTADL